MVSEKDTLFGVNLWNHEMKSQAMGWKYHGSPPKQKLCRWPSAGKIMASIFWDAEGIVMFDYS